MKIFNSHLDGELYLEKRLISELHKFEKEINSPKYINELLDKITKNVPEKCDIEDEEQISKLKKSF